MRIAVCIKQVPVISALQFDPQTKTLKREGVPNEVSAFDLRAVLKAVQLKAAHGGEVSVVTMGPPQARDALRQCLALGADRAVHLCDRVFAGADTLATARALAQYFRQDRFDLILCGRNSVDAETGQVGPELAELLDLPQIVGAHTLDVCGGELTAERELDDGFETVAAPLPALVTAAEDLAAERFPSKADRQAAEAKPLIELSARDLSTDPSQFGLVGSPTQVAALVPIEMKRLGRVIDGTAAAGTAELARILVDQCGLFGEWTLREQPEIAQMATAPQRSGTKDMWVVAEELGGRIRTVSCELLGKAAALARTIGGSASAVLFGHHVEKHAAALAAYGADRILIADDARLVPFRTEVHAGLLAEAIRRFAPGAVLVPATAMGRDLAPRVAARLQLGLTGDCIDLGIDADGRLLQYKPAFGGSIVAPIISRTLPEMATVRPGMLPLPKQDASRRAVIEALPLDGLGTSRTRIVSARPVAAAAAELDEAEIVVGVGKGLGGPEHLKTVEPLRDLLGATLGTTRDVTDIGWLPKQYQIGLTGRAIAPKLYFAIAIRGAFEHVIGLRRAGVVVAINNNPKAPIFKAADYGLVGDYSEIVPLLCQHLSQRRR